MLRAGLSEYAKQRLVRIQPTLDDHVGYGEFTSQVSERCVGSDVVSTQTRTRTFLSQPSDQTIFMLFSMIHKPIMNCLFIYVVAG